MTEPQTIHDRLDLQALEAQILGSPQTATKIGFRIERYRDQVPELLRLYYRAEVLGRGCPFIDDQHTGEHLQKAANWLLNVRRPKTGLIICGGTGNGKTTMARALAQTIQKCNNQAVTRITALQFATLEAERDENRYKLIQYRQAPVLFLDDVGMEAASVKVWGNVISPVVELIYQRYDLQLFTIATSNLNTRQLAEKYGDRVGDRIREMFNVLAFNNESYRGEI